MALNQTQFETILAALADKITEQEDTIAVQKWQIASLKKTIAEAENTGKSTPTKLEIR